MGKKKAIPSPISNVFLFQTIHMQKLSKSEGIIPKILDMSSKRTPTLTENVIMYLGTYMLCSENTKEITS